MEPLELLACSQGCSQGCRIGASSTEMVLQRMLSRDMVGPEQPQPPGHIPTRNQHLGRCHCKISPFSWSSQYPQAAWPKVMCFICASCSSDTGIKMCLETVLTSNRPWRLERCFPLTGLFPPRGADGHDTLSAPSPLLALAQGLGDPPQNTPEYLGLS